MRSLSALFVSLAVITVSACGSQTVVKETIVGETAAPESAQTADVPGADAVAKAQKVAAGESTALAAVNVEGNVAIAGADPVAYFTESAYVPGSSEFTHEWSGATWQFASAENRDAFASAPQQYAPQYGGFCAWAVSQGYTAPIDPEAWKVVDGKLYLNFDRNIQARWERDVPGNIAKADANWPEVVKN